MELTGLEPGQTYYYQAWSNGKPAAPTAFTLIAGNAVGTSAALPRGHAGITGPGRRTVRPAYLLAAGDISAEAVPANLSRAGQLLNRFGTYREDYFVVRGNHDRARVGDAYAACRVGQWQGNDCFHDAYFPGDEPTYFTTGLPGLRIIGIDTYNKAGGVATPAACPRRNSPGSRPNSPPTRTSPRSCSATTHSSCRTPRSRSPRATRWPRTRPPRFSPATP